MRERPAQLQRGIAADRRDYAIGAQFAGAKQAQYVAAQPFAPIVGQKRPVGIAVGRDDGVQPVLRRPVTGQCDILGAQRLGIDGDEIVRAAKRQDLRAKPPQDAGQEVAADGGMLVKPQHQP